MIPESDHPKSGSFQIRCSFRVLKCMFQMLSAIYLDNQFFFEANKIKDIVVKRMLSTELESI